jgi:hypothetical protein
LVTTRTRLNETRASANINDQLGGKDPDWAVERTAGGAPTLLVAVNPYTGLTRTDIDRVLEWLACLPTGPAT